MKELDAINETIEGTKGLIEKANALKRLKQNKDFQLLIMEGYLEKYPAELVRNKALTYTQDEKEQKFIDNSIIGIGFFHQFLNKITVSGEVAEAALESHEQERELILAEGGMPYAG